MAKVDPDTHQPMSDAPDGPEDLAGGKKPEDNKNAHQDPHNQTGAGQMGG